MGLIKVKPVEFDVSIYPVSALLTADGVQYADLVVNETTNYVDLFSMDTDTYFPFIIGDLAYVLCTFSFGILGGSNTPIVTYKVEAKNKLLLTWTIMSAEETYQTTTEYVEKKLEGYLKLTADLVDRAPLSIRVQFKSDGTDSTNRVSVKLKNDTVIRVIGVYKLV